MAQQVANTDFTDVDRSADAEHFVRHLDRISSMAQVQAYKRRTFDLLEVGEGSWVLDVGCGTGDDARVLAERVGTTGRVIGIDSSQGMVQEARKRAERLQLRSSTKWEMLTTWGETGSGLFSQGRNGVRTLFAEKRQRNGVRTLYGRRNAEKTGSGIFTGGETGSGLFMR